MLTLYHTLDVDGRFAPYYLRWVKVRVNRKFVVTKEKNVKLHIISEIPRTVKSIPH